MHFFHRETFSCLPNAMSGVQFRPKDMKIIQVRARPPVVAVSIRERVVSVQVEGTKGMTVVTVVAEGDHDNPWYHIWLYPLFVLYFPLFM